MQKEITLDLNSRYLWIIVLPFIISYTYTFPIINIYFTIFKITQYFIILLVYNLKHIWE